MKKMKSVLLVFYDQKEIEFIEANLIENGFQVFKSDNLKSALVLAEKKLPDLIVVNTLDSESDILFFSNLIKIQQSKVTTFLTLIELEDYFKTSSKGHFVMKPMRPKLLLSLIRCLMDHEEINWLSSVR
ncbi:MAG: hypothetical protein A3F72_03350 [Bacteroidetes bacterium RIFCSPLOWO2_12_FULL_35_15]|nr:MAG: hypothetical protein A3F72_03350 [Bacteroidetes bacterium RIFCSPLOWO2_12_FULL_35_15]